jgi:hypothetical protein
VSILHIIMVSARLASPLKAVVARRLERGAPRIGLFEHREGGGGKGGGDVAPVMVVVVGRVMVARLEAARVEAVMVVVAMVWERDASARGRQRVWWGGGRRRRGRWRRGRRRRGRGGEREGVEGV